MSLDEAIAVVQGALTRGEVGFAGLLSTHQLDHSGAWHRVCELSARWSNDPGRFDDPLVRELRALVYECAGSLQVPPDIYSINTTFHGKDTAFQDHAPKEGTP